MNKRFNCFLIVFILIFNISCTNSVKNTINTSKSTDLSTSENIYFGNFTNEYNYYLNLLNNIDFDLIADIVYGNISVEVNGQIIQITVEIIEDKNLGKKYHVCNDFIDIWIDGSLVEIIQENNMEKLTDIDEFRLELYINYLYGTKNNKDLIFVDIMRQKLHVFDKLNGYYFLNQTFVCSTGKITTPTKRGLYTIYEKGPVFYNNEKYYKCYNWLKYSNQYLIHSVPFSLDGYVLNNTMQQKISNGCVRLLYEDSKWLYENIEVGALIWIN